MLSSVDLSCVEAIARHGELAAAARELKRDPSTLFRWLKALETRLGASLFSRTRGRYVPSQRNSAGYGGLLLGISDSFLHKDQVSAKTGQLHTPAGRAARNRAVNRLGQGLAPLAGTLSDPEPESGSTGTADRRLVDTRCVPRGGLGRTRSAERVASQQQ